MTDESATVVSSVPALRLFVAGATGVIGSRLLPLLTRRGHIVAGMTRTASKAALVRELGAEPVVCDVYDAAALAMLNRPSGIVTITDDTAAPE